MVWRGKPIFVRHRTKKQIDEARSVNVASLPDPQTRRGAGQGRPRPVARRDRHLHPSRLHPARPEGEFGGWFCPCHGSQYDTSGRIRQGPAPLNLAIPPYAFASDTKIKIG